MKKFLLLAAGALLAGATASAQWAVVGTYTTPGWNFEASQKFVGEGDDLTCEIEYLTNDFKIIDITENNWDTQYGTSTQLEINTDYTLDGKDGGDDPSNMKFAGLIQGVRNATVEWNPSTHVMRIVAEESDLVIGYPELYVTGSFCGWAGPGDDGTVLMTEENGLYTATVTLKEENQSDGKIAFKVAGKEWANEIGGGVDVGTEAVEVGGSGDLFTTLVGTYILSLNYDSMQMWFTETEADDEEEGEGEGEETSATWAVVGSYSDPNWNFEASSILEGEGEVLSCTIDNFITSFKIVDIANNNWDTAYGYAEPVVPNQTYTLTLGGNNIEFGDNILSINNATIQWNPTTFELTIVAAEEDIHAGNPTLYVTGSFCGWSAPGQDDSVEMTEVDGIYTAVVNLGEEEGKTEFKLAGTGWSNEIAGGVEVGTTAVTVTKGGEDLYTYLTGERTLVFDYNEMTMYFEALDSDAIEGIGVDNNTPAVYYNLQGVKVENPSKGIYVVKQGNKTSKVVVK